MISVMIPAYNAASTIGVCLDSVLNQTMQDFEIVVINDGSTDSTPDILDAYVRKDARIRVFHQENAGVSAARNHGVRESRGGELTFLDSDDRLCPGYLAALHETMEKTGVPCVCCNHYIVDGQTRELRFEGEELLLLSAEQALEQVLYHGIPDVSPWGKLYKRELLEQIRYPEGKLFEDTWVIGELLLRAERVAFLPEPLYEYVISHSSISRSCNEGHIWDLCDAVDNLTSVIGARFPGLKKGCIRRKAHAVMSVMRTLDLRRHGQEWKKAHRALRGYAIPVLMDPDAPKRDKLGILAALPGHRFYRFAWGLYERNRRTYG